jgi:BirA family biotin operon repressor/biotin-[acetyl-CoA-carboxylase] ligase
MMLEPLPDDLASALAAARDRLGRFERLRYVADVDSTNDLAIALAVAGEPEGTAVLAESQRHGRGRRGRDWFSPPGSGLYLSVITRPLGHGSGVPLITLGAGVAVARAVREATGLSVELKWPNDLVVGRPWRKLGGVLCEAVGAGATLDAVIVGIGVNLRPAAYPREIADRATALETELGRAVDRAPLVAAVLGALRAVVDDLEASRQEAICRAWREFGAAGLAGAGVRWRDHDDVCRGRARDIDHDGALLVDRDGRIERLIAGEVFWEGLSRE